MRDGLTSGNARHQSRTSATPKPGFGSRHLTSQHREHENRAGISWEWIEDVAGTDNADPVADYGVWHVPQYMPGFPTAATIWPRVVDVRCAEDNACTGYLITPAMGRGEYLFFRPIKK